MKEDEEEKPILESAKFIFTQKANCVDGGSDDFEELEIRCESSLGIDRDGDCFYILKTESWSIDSIQDLEKLIERMNYH